MKGFCALFCVYEGSEKMKKIFLTSNLGCSYKIDGVRYPKVIDNVNGIIEQLKQNLNNENNFLFFASSPDDYEKNDSQSYTTFKSFNMSGFNFKNLIIVDYRYKRNLISDIKKADIIYLAGGHTPTEIKYFNEIELKELLREYDGIVLGQSAGALNLADTVVCSPEYEEEIGTEYIWKGLGLTNINVEPHFTMNEAEINIKVREELLNLTNKYKIYAICDGSHIFDDGNKQTLYGEGYLIEKREIKKICENGKYIELDEE